MKSEQSFRDLRVSVKFTNTHVMVVSERCSERCKSMMSNVKLEIQEKLLI